jgi:DHA1 family bicyclomycin/chloramphenicol resistance-like MFS transporter
MAVGRVIINDSFDKTEAGRQLSTITMIMAIVPMLGFVGGGLVADIIGWRGTVGIMVITAGVIFLANMALLAETNHNRVARAPILKVVGVFYLLLRKREFVVHATSGALLTAAFFALGGFMPYEFQRLGASATMIGLLFSITAFGYMSGNNLSRYMGPRLGLERTVFIGGMVSLAAVVMLLALYLAGLAAALVIAGCLYFFGVANGLVVANSIICAVRAAGPNSGAATGLCGAMQMIGSAGFGSLIIALGGDQNFLLALGVVIFMSGMAALASWMGARLPS